MASRASKPVTVTLGPLTEQAEALVRSGRYASMSEVMREGLRALQWREEALDAVLKAKVERAMASSRPTIPIDEVFAALRARAAARRAKDGSA